MSKLEICKYQKYEGMFSKIGVLDDANHSMFWMDDDYVWGTLSEVTKNMSIYEFIYEIINLLCIDVPNITKITTELGFFDEGQSKIQSNNLHNKNIEIMTIYDIFYQKEKILIFSIKSQESIGVDFIKYVLEKDNNIIYLEENKFISYKFVDLKNMLYVYLIIDEEITIIQSTSCIH